ncbi:MAG: hypothetical protein AAF682_29200, partial [Planctomycetota bacterium]
CTARLKIGLSEGNPRAGGSTLPILLMVAGAISVVALVRLQVSSSMTRRVQVADDQSEAFRLAEAGFAEALHELDAGRTGQVATADSPLPSEGGVFWVEAQPQGEGAVRLESTGVWGSGRVTLALDAHSKLRSVAALGLFSDDDARVGPSVLVDSYDSSLATYAEQIGSHMNEFAVLSTNGDVALGVGSEVRGDVTPGPGRALGRAHGQVVGDVRPRRSLVQLPPVDVPDVPLSAAVAHDGAEALVLGPGTLGFAGLTLEPGTEALVRGPVQLVVGDLHLAEAARLELDASAGEIDLYVTGELGFERQAELVSAHLDPAALTVWIAAEGIEADLDATADFRGFVYAPRAGVRLGSHFEVFGGLAARSVDLRAGARVHLDFSLARRKEGLPGFVSWQAVEPVRSEADPDEDEE